LAHRCGLLAQIHERPSHFWRRFGLHSGARDHQARGKKRHIGTLVNGLLGAAHQVFCRSLEGCGRAAEEPDMPTMTDTDSILLAVAAFLFAFAVIALIAWAFKTFMLTGRSGGSFLKGRERRLGVVESAAVDGHRKLVLIRRDNVEHLIMTGGPVDVVIETGIEGHRHLEPPLEDVVIARTDARPVPDLGSA
jgi:flagellar protein FliO/FliZ